MVADDFSVQLDIDKKYRLVAVKPSRLRSKPLKCRGEAMPFFAC